MPYKISGTKSETARVIIVKESDWSIESNTVVSGSGAYSIEDLETSSKLALARNDFGKIVGFGGITPEFYELLWGDQPPVVKVLDNPDAYDTSVGDRFGYVVAIDGNNCIVGADREDDASGTSSGKAYIFNVTTGALLQTLDNPNPVGTSANDSFGCSVSIDGNNCIVGAVGEDDAGGLGAGKAYIFNVTTGALLQTLDDPNAHGTSANDRFGYSVAIDGNNCIVGAYEEDVGGSGSGSVYIYNVTTGALLHTLADPNAYGTPSGDKFGYSVAIDGNNCIVGAYGEDHASGTYSGSAYIFNVTTGALLHTLDNPSAYDTPAGDRFGYVVAIEGNNCIVGAYFEGDTGGLLDAGKAYIFNVTTGALLQTIDNPSAYGTPVDDTFGNSVAIDGTNCIVGAFAEDDAEGSGSGKAYIISAG